MIICISIFVGIIAVILSLLRIIAVCDIDYVQERQIDEICYSCSAFIDCGGGINCETIKRKDNQ